MKEWFTTTSRVNMCFYTKQIKKRWIFENFIQKTLKLTKRECQRLSDVIFSQLHVPNFPSLPMDAGLEGRLPLDTRSTSYVRLATSWLVDGAACVCRLGDGAASSPSAAVHVLPGFWNRFGFWLLTHFFLIQATMTPELPQSHPPSYFHPLLPSIPHLFLPLLRLLHPLPPFDHLTAPTSEAPPAASAQWDSPFRGATTSAQVANVKGLSDSKAVTIVMPVCFRHRWVPSVSAGKAWAALSSSLCQQPWKLQLLLSGRIRPRRRWQQLHRSEVRGQLLV